MTTIPGTEVAALAIGASLVGMVGHWAKKYYKDDHWANLHQYFVQANPKASIAAVITTVGACFGLMAAHPLPVDFASLNISDLAPYFLIGFAADSAVNNV